MMMAPWNPATDTSGMWPGRDPNSTVTLGANQPQPYTYVSTNTLYFSPGAFVTPTPGPAVSARAMNAIRLAAIRRPGFVEYETRTRPEPVRIVLAPAARAAPRGHPCLRRILGGSR